MNRPLIKKVLVPVDFSETSTIALDHAVKIASVYSAEIVMIHVDEVSGLSTTLKKMVFNSSSEVKVLAEEVDNRLMKLTNRYKDWDVTISSVKATGKIYKAIVETAEEMEIGLIVMGTHGTNGIESFVAGSNTFKVVSSAPCPVISVHADSGTSDYKRIVLPIDTSKQTREKVDYAIKLAITFDATIHVLGVSLAKNDDTVLFKLNKLVEQVVKFIEDEGITCVSEIKSGENITKLTLKHAHEINADLILIMTEQEPHITGLFMGPYAQQMINTSHIPVMSVRPVEQDYSMVTPY
jgi:nucleotide-binding universal stress UspA family protein